MAKAHKFVRNGVVYSKPPGRVAAKIVKRAVKRPNYEVRTDVVVYHPRPSDTAREVLSPGLRARRIAGYKTKNPGVPIGALVLNYGGTGHIGVPTKRIINAPDAVRAASNKLRTFQLLKAANVPSLEWTVERALAEQWLEKGRKLFARTTLNGSSGRGIRIIERREDMVAAPLYTRYFPKTHEFRVHVVDGVAIDVSEKKLREEKKDERAKVTLIRSHDNGWVHAHGNLSLGGADLETIKRLGVQSCAALGLDFGGVDILATLGGGPVRRLKTALVCEVNSAPGIENTVTKQAYIKAFEALIAKKRAA